MSLNQKPLQSPIAPASTEQQGSSSPRRNKILKVIGLILAIIGITFFVIPVAIFLLGMIYGVLSSGPPLINVAVETKSIQSYLYERYGKEFEVGNIEGHGAQALGDRPYITADAYPKDDKELKVFLNKKSGDNYTDNYLQEYWSKKNKEILASKLHEIFGTVSTFGGAITPNPPLNQSDMRGRVIPLEEVFSKYSHQVTYRVTADLGDIGDTTQETISAKLYQLILYMRQQIKGAGSSVGLSYETQDATYTCSLPQGFDYDFIENVQQLYGCWTKKLKENPNPKNNYGSMITLKDPSLPVTFKGSDVQLAKIVSAKGASATYKVSQGLQSLATISVYETGYGKKINQEKKDFASNWLRSNVAVSSSANSTLLTPTASVTIGAFAYRADSSASARTVHYVMAYKNYLIYVQAQTLNGNTDIRNKEFYLKDLIDTIEPLDGFSSI